VARAERLEESIKIQTQKVAQGTAGMKKCF